jgi:hypothetical protein
MDSAEGCDLARRAFPGFRWREHWNDELMLVGNSKSAHVNGRRVAIDLRDKSTREALRLVVASDPEDCGIPHTADGISREEDDAWRLPLG